MDESMINQDVLQITKTNNPLDFLSRQLDISFNRAVGGIGKLSDFTTKVPGQSGQVYRRFINNLIGSVSEARYLEIGSLAGSTACAAMDGNRVQITCLDDWSYLGGKREDFVRNTGHLMTSDIDLKLVEGDFRKADVAALGRFNVYLYDGPHDIQEQYDALALFKGAVDDDFIFIVDDWNWGAVRDGTWNAIKAGGYRVDFYIEVRTTLDGQHPAKIFGGESDWHNGYFIGKLTALR